VLDTLTCSTKEPLKKFREMFQNLQDAELLGKVILKKAGSMNVVIINDKSAYSSYYKH
jgi:hypothetical protein